MVLLQRSVRFSASRLSRLLPPLSACPRWIPSTAAAVSPEIRAGLAPRELELPPTRGCAGGSFMGSLKNPESPHAVLIGKDFTMVPACKVAGMGAPQLSYSQIDKFPKPVSSYTISSAPGMKIYKYTSMLNKNPPVGMYLKRHLRSPTSPHGTTNTSTSRAAMPPCMTTSRHHSCSSQQHITDPSCQLITPTPPKIITSKPRFSCLQQLNFFCPVDAAYEEWEHPLIYLKNNPAIDHITPLGLMLVEKGRVLVRSLVKLVAVNRKRGYDIAKCLHPDNLLVSKTFGTFSIVDLKDYEPASDTSPFLGYKAAKVVLQDLFEQAYWVGVIDDLTDDVAYFFALLCHKKPDERIILYNGTLLSRAGRIGFTVKLDILLRNDLNRHNFQDWDILSKALCQNLPHTATVVGDYPTDQIHNQFFHWRLHSVRHTSVMYKKSKIDLSLSGWKAETGRWLVIMNRNGVLHPKGSQSGSVDLLHYYLPMYIPKAQEEVIHAGFWRQLSMPDFFPEDNLIGPAVISDDR